MSDYSEVPPPPSDPDEYKIETEEEKTSNTNSVDVDNWQQQLVDTEQEILREKESGKRSIPIDENQGEDEPSIKKRATEFEKLWKNVTDNPSDFQGWTLLLQHVDQSNDLESGRKAYDNFFKRYPYCYGYWKKYAELEKRKGSQDSTMRVFGRGLEAIGLSVDLWVHYMDFVMVKYADDETFIRDEFEKAIEACGLEFRSDKLWDQYICWENAGQRWRRTTALYQRLLPTPISKYMQHWQRFQDHIKRHCPSESLGADEYLRLRKEVLSDLNQTDNETPDEAPPGVETVPGNEKINDDEEAKVIQRNLIESWQKIHEETVVEVKARWSYEDAIKRPYFHVKPLEKSQLNAWRSYLEFEISQNKHSRIKILFERCLIACAFYEEFWMRYISYLESHGAPTEELRNIYVRMCTIHLKDKLRPHLSWASFEEESGNANQALEILGEVQSRIPFCLESYVMSAAIERRRGDLEAADQFYTSCINTFKTKYDTRAYSALLIKYGRFLTLFKNDPQKAVEVIQEGLEIDESNSNLLLALVDNCLACRPPNFDIAAHTLKMGTMNYFPPSTRMMFAHRYVSFITECGMTSKCLKEALQTLREVQQEVRQIDIASEDSMANPSKMIESGSALKKQLGTSTAAVAEKTSTSSATAAPSSVNGSSPAPTSQPVSSYSNYGSQGYNYNQSYPQSYGGGQYQGWGYPSQQGGYGYNQQSWGGYPNYYGQR